MTWLELVRGRAGARIGRSGSVLVKALLWAVGLGLAGAIAWGAWGAVSGWNVTKAELAAFDAEAKRTKIVNDSLQLIITANDSTLDALAIEKAARIAEQERERRILAERARVQLKASIEAGEMLDAHLLAKNDTIGLELHAQEKALTNAERLTWGAEKRSLLTTIAEERSWRDSIQSGYDQLWLANQAAQEALIASDARGDKWKDAARPTIGKVIKRTIIPVVVAIGATVLVNQAN